MAHDNDQQYNKLRDIIELTMQHRAREFKHKYSDKDKDIVFRHAKPFAHAKQDKLVEALERGFMEIEGTTNPW